MGTSTAETQIAKAMVSPASVSADGVSVRAPSIQEQIAAAEFLASQTATRRKHSTGMRIQQIVPPGAVSRGYPLA